GHIAFKQKVNAVDFTLRGNITYSKNEILERDEQNTIYDYLLDKGHRVDQARGLIALGLFKDEDDIRYSPRQTFGEVMPGDIKYKDVNGDGIINSLDMVPLTHSNYPLTMYGFGGEFRYKKLTLGMLFKGTGRTSFFYGGMGYVPFFASSEGNVLSIVADPKNRWI